MPGEVVLDQRFGHQVYYEVGPEGSLRTDEWIAARAASHAMRDSPGELGERVEAKLELDATGEEKSTTFELDLGERLIGTGVPVELEIQNAGPVLPSLGPVLPDCGCTGVRLSRRELRPGASASLQAIQWIQAAGSQRSLIVIGTDAGMGRGLRIELRFTGLEK